MKVNELLHSFEIFMTNEERKVMKKLSKPIKLATLSEEDQFKVEGLIRKSLVTKIGHDDPSVVANDKI